MELQRILKRYPRPAELRDGGTVVLRALLAEDEEKLVALFADIPYEELRNLRDNVADPSVVRHWCHHVDYGRVLPIVAEADGMIIADATLHRRRVGPARDVGRLRAYVRPEHRGRGLGAVLLHELIALATVFGLHRIAVELYEDQHSLIQMFHRYGFHEEGRLPTYQTVLLVRELPHSAAA